MSVDKPEQPEYDPPLSDPASWFRHLLEPRERSLDELMRDAKNSRSLFEN